MQQYLARLLFQLPELEDVAAHQLVQLVGGEGGDNPAILALLVRERGEEQLEEHERWRQAVQGADEGRKELVQLLYQSFLLQKLSSHAARPRLLAGWLAWVGEATPGGEEQC